MSFPGNSRHVPKFLSAPRAKGLRRLMLENNLKNGKEFHYFDIQYVADDKRWYAWYMDKIDLNVETGEDE